LFGIWVIGIYLGFVFWCLGFTLRTGMMEYWNTGIIYAGNTKEKL
jgi:hypothetical protein